MVSNHRLPNSQRIELVDRANNNSNIDVTSQQLPEELDPTGGDGHFSRTRNVFVS